jgi:predicted XRE-type DNA-binding protein
MGSSLMAMNKVSALGEQTKTLIEAAQFLGISRKKMSDLARKNVIEFQSNPLDGRQKRFRISDLVKLKEAAK